MKANIRDVILAFLIGFVAGAFFIAADNAHASGVSSVSTYNPTAVAITGGTIGITTVSQLNYGESAWQVLPASAGTSYTAVFPTWARHIRVVFDRVSMNNTGTISIKFGVGGVIDSTGYYGTDIRLLNASAIVGGNNATQSAIKLIGSSATIAADTYSGIIDLYEADATNFIWWIQSQAADDSAGTYFFLDNARKQFSGAVDSMSIYATLGAFDAGQFKFLYWGN